MREYLHSADVQQMFSEMKQAMAYNGLAIERIAFNIGKHLNIGDSYTQRLWTTHLIDIISDSSSKGHFMNDEEFMKVISRMLT